MKGGGGGGSRGGERGGRVRRLSRDRMPAGTGGESRRWSGGGGGKGDAIFKTQQT